MSGSTPKTVKRGNRKNQGLDADGTEPGVYLYYGDQCTLSMYRTFSLCGSSLWSTRSFVTRWLSSSSTQSTSSYESSSEVGSTRLNARTNQYASFHEKLAWLGSIFSDTWATTDAPCLYCTKRVVHPKFEKKKTCRRRRRPRQVNRHQFAG